MDLPNAAEALQAERAKRHEAEEALSRIEERRRVEMIELQTRCLQAARLASLGEVVAGVAHEINDPSNGIINYAQMLCDSSEENSEQHEIAIRILQEGRRIAETVKGLLLYASCGRGEKTAVRLDKIVSAALSLIGPLLGRDGIAILSTIPTDLPDLIADPQAIQQVLLNIIGNARHALNQKYDGAHDRKTLELCAEGSAIDNRAHVRITVLDHGVGIPPGVLPRIREPFFSTRPAGKGTGLGLSICDRIIDEHAGKLSIESVEGEFTKVVLELPAKEKDGG